jgi:hypothetical protein
MPSDPGGAAAQPMELGTLSTASIGGLSLAPGTADRAFTFRTAQAGVYRILAPGTAIRVLDGSSSLVRAGEGRVTVRSRWPGATFLIELGDASGTPIASSLSINLVAPGLRLHSRGFVPHRVVVHRIHHA